MRSERLGLSKLVEKLSGVTKGVRVATAVKLSTTRRRRLLTMPYREPNGKQRGLGAVFARKAGLPGHLTRRRSVNAEPRRVVYTLDDNENKLCGSIMK